MKFKTKIITYSFTEDFQVDEYLFNDVYLTEKKYLYTFV